MRRYGYVALISPSIPHWLTGDAYRSRARARTRRTSFSCPATPSASSRPLRSSPPSRPWYCSEFAFSSKFRDGLFLTYPSAVLLHLGLHGQGRGHGDGHHGAAGGLLGLFRRRLPRPASRALRRDARGPHPQAQRAGATPSHTHTSILCIALARKNARAREQTTVGLLRITRRRGW